MNTLIVKTKDNAERIFLNDLLRKLKIKSSALSDEEVEDMGLSMLMHDVDKTKKVSREVIMKKLQIKMKVEFTEKFYKDLSHIRDRETKDAIQEAIMKLEQAKKISDLKGLKKLGGHASAFRMRAGDYRIGFFYENNCALLARVRNRKDIYKLFP